VKKLTLAQLAAHVAQLEERLAALEGAKPEDPARAGFLSFRHRARAMEDKRLEGRRGE
jgi:hypothetical protein